MTFFRNRNVLALVVCALALSGAAAGCGGGGGSSLPSGNVAQVDGENISQADLDALVASAINSAKATGAQVAKKGSAEYDQLEQRGVQYLVQKLEYEQQARKAHVTATPAEIDAQLNALIKQYFNGSEKRYQQELKRRHVTDASVRSDVRLQVIQKNLLRNVTAGIVIAEADAREYYLQHAPTYSTPQSREIEHILVKDKALADKLYTQLQAGADFATLAKKYSTDPGSKVRGGKLGAVAKGQTVPAFDKVAFELETGKLSQPLHTQFGWHIIKALGPVKPRKVIAFPQVKAQIQQQLLQAKQNQAVSAWQTKFQNFYKSKIKYASGFAPPATTAAPTTTSIVPTTPAQTG